MSTFELQCVCEAVNEDWDKYKLIANMLTTEHIKYSWEEKEKEEDKSQMSEAEIQAELAKMNIIMNG